uniref:40S ribosomal protein S27 n=2 Tax=Leersia perrieri TaxID=77586 RepID=A0A0D9VFZ7_9ORYZ
MAQPTQKNHSLKATEWDIPIRREAAAAFELAKMVLSNDIDLLNPPAELEKLKHKKKRLVQSPNSFFMDVKCQGCFNITTVFSHSQTVVVCPGCQTVLCQPTGGKARLTEGCSFRRKTD